MGVGVGGGMDVGVVDGEQQQQLGERKQEGESGESY